MENTMSEPPFSLVPPPVGNRAGLHAAAILLAAGISSRMGRPKALLKTPAGETFLTEIGAAVRNSSLAPWVIVTNHGLADAVGKLAPGAQLVMNPTPRDGQLSSLKLGLFSLLEHARAQSLAGVVVFLVDTPGNLAHRTGILMEKVSEFPEVARAAGHKGFAGHPLWLPRARWDGILDWRGPNGLKGYLDASTEPLEIVETCNESISDIDTPSDYDRFMGHSS